jgi:hypothetical protein
LIDDNGWPLLPEPIDDGTGKERLNRAKDIIRAFITEQYKLATGGTQTIVPWNKITASPSIFIDTKYLPDQPEAFNEPSRMRWTDADACLNHWRGRQLEGDSSKTFRFKRILVKKEVVHVQYNGAAAAAAIRDGQGRVGTSAPIPNDHPPPIPVAPLPRPTRKAPSKINNDAYTRVNSTEPADDASDDNLLRRVATSPVSPVAALETPRRGSKRPANAISPDPIALIPKAPTRKALAGPPLVPVMPPPIDPTIPITRRGVRRTSSYLNPHAEADDWLHRQEAAEAAHKAAEPAPQAGPSNSVQDTGLRRGSRDRPPSKKQKLFETTAVKPAAKGPKAKKALAPKSKKK